jgi:hypothetical protein
MHVLQALEKLIHYFGCLSFAKTFSATMIKTYNLIFGLVHASADEVIQILAFDKLHHEVNLAVRLNDVVELWNLRVTIHSFKDLDLS